MIAVIPPLDTVPFPLGLVLDQNGNISFGGKAVGNVANLWGILGDALTTLVNLVEHLPSTPVSIAASSATSTPRIQILGEAPLSPAQAPRTGLMQIQGNYTQAAKGILAIAIGGTNFVDGGTMQYDRLQVSGLATLGGTVTLVPVDLSGGNNPPQIPAGAQFDVVVARNIQLDGLTLTGPLTGTFKVVDLPNARQALRVTIAPAAGPKLAITQQANQIVVSLPASATGFSLQSTTDLNSGIWNPVSPVNGTFTITPSGKRQFFRLKK
jgi:hypothetical protein